MVEPLTAALTLHDHPATWLTSKAHPTKQIGESGEQKAENGGAARGGEGWRERNGEEWRKWRGVESGEERGEWREQSGEEFQTSPALREEFADVVDDEAMTTRRRHKTREAHSVKRTTSNIFETFLI